MSFRVFKGFRALLAPAKSATASKSTATKTTAAKPKPKPKPKATSTTPKAPTGILKPKPVSPVLSEFLGGVHEASRTDAVKKIWSHIKLHNLQNPTNKREIFCDAKLKTLFDGKDKLITCSDNVIDDTILQKLLVLFRKAKTVYGESCLKCFLDMYNQLFDCSGDLFVKLSSLLIQIMMERLQHMMTVDKFVPEGNHWSSNEKVRPLYSARQSGAEGHKSFNKRCHIYTARKIKYTKLNVSELSSAMTGRRDELSHWTSGGLEHRSYNAGE
ncbi:unnamed protein product [Dovyalis caffra]|uniref:DM2 domain-containing protein n=1 Tax=Dovyalis caffra TaxID=77055 RepID=A0AAV1RX92_9ROSI|nr:unnamed protein product [Dovyalis caffra]